MPLEDLGRTPFWVGSVEDDGLCGLEENEEIGMLPFDCGFTEPVEVNCCLILLAGIAGLVAALATVDWELLLRIGFFVRGLIGIPLSETELLCLLAAAVPMRLIVGSFCGIEASLELE